MCFGLKGFFKSSFRLYSIVISTDTNPSVGFPSNAKTASSISNWGFS